MAGERTGPVTWAQQEWFADLGDQEDDAASAATNASAHFDAHRLPVATAIRALDDVVRRHDGLRTHIDRTAWGERLQSLCTDGAITDVVHLVPDGPDEAAVFAATTATAFRLHKEWPVRFVLGTDGAAVTRIGAIIDHVSSDAWAWKVLGADVEAALRARAAGREPFAGSPPVEQPLDSADRESGPAGERHAQRAAGFWRRQLETLRAGLGGRVPAPAPPVGSTLPADRDPAPDVPVLRQFRLASARTATAAETLHAAAGIRPSALYLAAFAAAVAAVEGTEVAGVRVLTANRLTPAVEASVRKAVMPALLVVPAGGFADRLAATAAQQWEAFRFANLPPRLVAALDEEILGARRGSGAVAARFNFIDNSVVPGHLNTTSLGGENIRFVDPAVQGRITADPPRPGGSRHILSVQHQPRGALLTLACHEDTAWAPAAADMLWHIEDLMVWAAAGRSGPEPRFGRSR